MATKTGISQPQSHLGVALRATAAFGRPGGAYYPLDAAKYGTLIARCLEFDTESIKGRA